MQKPGKILRLILGDQLNQRHTWFCKADHRVTYVMMEVRQETDYVRHHIQKVLAFFAGMRGFANYLKHRKHRLIYFKLDDPVNTQNITENIEYLLKKEPYQKFEYLYPDEYRLDKQLRDFSNTITIPSQVVDTEHFLTNRNELKSFFRGKKQYLQESFYRYMRKKHNILMENNKPLGGKWNYDKQNRNRYDYDTPLPPVLSFSNDVSALQEMIYRAGVKTVGALDSNNLIWPVNRKQTLELLANFIKYGLPFFGTYQDAMTKNNEFMFHSRLSFALNTKMISPEEVVNNVIEAWQKKPEMITLNQLEGFIRQIIGWREYMRGIYWAFMPKYSEMNFFGHTNRLPHYYWNAKTNMQCMHHVIKQTLKHAYAHHIQRLMITGNFALLAGIHPDEVDSWYLGVFIDAVEWVEITNTRGMSQFADGGIVASKPYISTANYIQKMSDYCTNCHYDHTAKYGDGACPFNSLYWYFYRRNQKLLSDNPRIAMMYRTWERFSSSEQGKIVDQATKYLANIEKL